MSIFRDNINVGSYNLERCPRGLRCRLGKSVCKQLYRGFESRLLRILSCVEFIMRNLLPKILTFYIPNRALRRKLRTKIKNIICGYKVFTRAKRIGKDLVLGNPCVLNKDTYIGDNVRLNGLTVEGFGSLHIGNYAQIGMGTTIITSNHDYDNGKLIPYDEIHINKNVIIDDFVWIGSRAIILPGAVIGEGAIIQAGAVVHGIIPPYAIAGGSPAKVFKFRDIEHFKKLKQEEKFLIDV